MKLTSMILEQSVSCFTSLYFARLVCILFIVFSQNSLYPTSVACILLDQSVSCLLYSARIVCILLHQPVFCQTSLYSVYCILLDQSVSCLLYSPRTVCILPIVLCLTSLSIDTACISCNMKRSSLEWVGCRAGENLEVRLDRRDPGCCITPPNTAPSNLELSKVNLGLGSGKRATKQSSLI